MSRLLPSLLILVVTAPEASADRPARPAGTVASGEWQITWSPTGASARHRRSGAELQLYQNSEQRDGAYERSRLVSVVGPVVSVQYESNDESGFSVHPESEKSLKAMRLEPGAPEADVTDLFDAADVLRALMKVRRVQQALEDRVPSTLGELVEACRVECWTGWSSVLRSFAVVSVRHDTAVVRFGVGHGCSLLAGNITVFDVPLPIPKSRRAWFKEARAAGTIGMAPTAADSVGEVCCPE